MSHRYRSLINFLTLCLFCITCSMPVVYADTLTIPNSFTAGTPAQAAQVNQNFSAVAGIVNGSIANDNIKSGANIAASKLDLTAAVSPTNEWFVKRASNNRLVSGGVTGDTVPRVSLFTDSSGRGGVFLGAGSSSAQDVGIVRLSAGGLGVMSGATTHGALSSHTISVKQSTSSDNLARVGFVTSAYPGIEFGDGSSPADISIERRGIAGKLFVRASGSDGDLRVANIDITGNTTSNALVPALTPGGRLTLISGTPVTGDVTGAGTLYYTPYISNVYPRYTTANGTYATQTFSELSLTLSISSGTNYDVFIKNNALTTLAWSTDTARATALARSTISGLLYKSGDEESLYVGTIRGSGAGTTEDSRSKRYVWNMYNRVLREMYCQDTTDTWTYTLAAYQEANAASTEGISRIGFVRGLDEDAIQATNLADARNSSTAVGFACAIGLDSSTAFSGVTGRGVSYVANNMVPLIAFYTGVPGLGYHTLRRLEQSTATGTTTWDGDAGATTYQTGMRATMPM